MIAKGILFSYIAIGTFMVIYYLGVCVRYWTSQDLREFVIIRYGEEHGSRLLASFTKPSMILFGIFLSFFFWPTVLKGYIEEKYGSGS